MKNLATLCHYSSFAVQFNNSISMTKVILRFTVQIVEIFEQHACMDAICLTSNNNPAKISHS